MTKFDRIDVLDQLLNLYWLRPETALWRHIDIQAMNGFEFASPSLDLGCGDGNFSFIRGGGAFAHSFDAFRSVAGLNEFFQNTDVFDSYDTTFQPNILRYPNYKIDIGFDHKDNLLKKASTLGLYKSLKVGDANNGLPFESNSFNSIFSNVVYWLDDPVVVLKEIQRVLSPDGQVCLMLPDRCFSQFSFYENLYVRNRDPKWAFLEFLDRGRFADNIRQGRTRIEWEETFNECKLSVVSHRRHLSERIVRIWDIGLRPLFPVLMKMVREIPPEKLPAIKAEWVNTLKIFLGPLIELEIGEQADAVDKAFHCYILKKANTN